MNCFPICFTVALLTGCTCSFHPVLPPVPTASPSVPAALPTFNIPTIPPFDTPAPNLIVVPMDCNAGQNCLVQANGFESFQILDLYINGTHAAKMLWNKKYKCFEANVTISFSGPVKLSIQTGDDVVGTLPVTVLP
jgi:hypothetical protein